MRSRYYVRYYTRPGPEWKTWRLLRGVLGLPLVALKKVLEGSHIIYILSKKGKER